MRQIIVCLVWLLVALPSLAAEYETTTTTAIGASQEKAVSKALAQAIAQVNGQVVAQKMDIRETEDRVYMGFWGNTIEIPAREINRGYTQSYSQGVVRRYTVQSVEYLKDQNQYRVTVEAEVQALGDYQNIGEDRSNLVPIVVAPFKASSSSYEGLNGALPATEVVERITDELTAVLAQSNRFRVLDRANMRNLLSEDFVTAAMGQRTGQQVKFSQKLSADIVIVGSVRQFDVASRKVESYGQQFENYEGEMVLDIRAVETATGEVRFAKRFEEYLDHNQIKAGLDHFDRTIFNPSQKADKRRVQYAIEAMMIEQIGNDVIQAFYPDYQPQASGHRLPDYQADEPTHMSDTPGSSEKPWNWQE